MLLDLKQLRTFNFQRRLEGDNIERIYEIDWPVFEGVVHLSQEVFGVGFLQALAD